MVSINKKYIPLDKSWIIRMGILDLLNGYGDIGKFLSKHKNLGEDLLALKRVAKVWKSNKPLDVGESGTLYRFLKFASWKLKLSKRFITRGTLLKRKIKDDPKIVKLSQRELLKLDNHTSQWASIAALVGDPERISKPPFKLQLTYDAISHWKSQRKKGRSWAERFDETILNQAKMYTKLLKGKKLKFIPKQAEDFCFAYVFGCMNASEGKKRWPALIGHESNRIVEIQKTLEAAKRGKDITSKDHRVVQAITMWGKVNKKEINILYPDSVKKSWPQFWDFLSFSTFKP